jgi:hypothetical protein
MRRWQVSILIFELVLFAAILVLPQVALPAFTCHGGTAPAAAHARVSDPATRIAIAVAPQILLSKSTTRMRREIPDVSAPPAVHSRLARLCVLIC